MSHKTKKRIRNKHHHHEEHLRESIREEVLEEFVEREQRLLARIDYLVGANNEAFEMLRKCEESKIEEEVTSPPVKETASEALMNDPF